VNTEELVKQCDEWQKGNKGVSNLTKVVKEEMESISLSFVWHNKQEYHFRGRNKPIMEICNNVDWQIMAAKLSDKSSLVLHLDKDFG
jgi:hypothetical protein